MNPAIFHRAWLPALAACTALLGCQQRVIEPDREAGGSDEIDTRVAMDAKGRPLVGARVSLVKVGDSTGRLAALSSTGSQGQYPSFNVPDGQYSVTLRDAQDSLGKFLDTLEISAGKAKAGRDTLLALGKIRGVVRLVGGETPASVIMSLYGTDIAANVGNDGSFEIELVPGGLFTLMGSTSLDGYGTLLRRLQLRDGQDLVIPDTLSLPVTGLLAPANIWVESDTGTGDVRVRWSQVDHPNRMGYVLERLENGVVTRSQFLTDTVWTDSLKGYWEGLPLLGPWPAREAVYRVSTRPLSGKVDSRSVAQSFVAKAPEWTHRIDSVGMVMTNDSAAEISRFRWKPFQHPNVSEWRMVRLADGVEDCSGIPVGGAWSDSACKSATLLVIDSTKSGSPKSRVFQQKNPLLTYQLVAHRKSGMTEIHFSGTKQTKITSWFEWEKVDDPGRDGWILEYGRAKKAGSGGWEVLPECTSDASACSNNRRVFGFGDSLWVIDFVDPFHLKISALQGSGVWKATIVKTRQWMSGARIVFVYQGALAFTMWDDHSGQFIAKFIGDTLDYSYQGIPGRDNVTGVYSQISSISDSFFYESVLYRIDAGRSSAIEVLQVNEKMEVESKTWEFFGDQIGPGVAFGVDKESFVWWSKIDSYILQRWNGDGYVVGDGAEYAEMWAVKGILYANFNQSGRRGIYKANFRLPSGM